MKMHKVKRTLRPIVLGLTAALLVGSLGVASASADDSDPTGDTPSATPTGTPSATDSPTPTPSDAPSETPSQSPSASPSAPASKAPAAAKGVKYTVPLYVGGYYNPLESVVFNYPYSTSTNRYALRNQVIAAIKAVPRSGKIRIAMYSLNDNALVDALIAARKRNVSTQVVVNEHNVHGTPGHASSPPFIRLYKTFGQSRGDNTNYDKVSWARYCVKSCRGTGGNVHYKMILLSSTIRTDGNTATPHVTMMGSPNLTMLAATGQWNHLYTRVDDSEKHELWSDYYDKFREMALDRPANPQFVDYSSIYPETYFFPKPGTKSTTDPAMLQLRDVVCTGADPAYSNKGRTIIRIGQYAWFDNRGTWLAKRVRQLWDQGCDVSVETAVMGNTVKSILYSPSGRGRIPIRQVGTYAKDGTVKTYDHAKWISIAGRFTDMRGRQTRSGVRINSGTINWNNLPLYSDDSMQIFDYDATQADQGRNGPNNRAIFTLLYKRYFANYQSIWTGPHSFAPSPTSKIAGDVGEGKSQQLAQGKYRNVETN